MSLIPIVERLLLIKRDLRNSLSFHKFCPFLAISVEQTQVEMSGVVAFVLRQHKLVV